MLQREKIRDRKMTKKSVEILLKSQNFMTRKGFRTY